jgi:hypothetical protein
MGASQKRRYSSTRRSRKRGFGKLIYGYGKGHLFDLDGYFNAAEPWIHQPVDHIMTSANSWRPADDWAKFVVDPKTWTQRKPK